MKREESPIKVRQYFRRNLMRIMRHDILDAGYPKNVFKTEDIFYLHSVLMKRLIRSHPRNILYSDTFVRPTDANLLAGLEKLEDKIRNGENINPHLSTRLDNILFFDGMLYDWGIYHFHLGAVVDGAKYSERTGDILYAFVTNETVYFLTIAGHGHWEDKELLEIFASNWSEYTIEGEVRPLNFTPDEIKRWRMRGINVIHNLSNGKSLPPMGMGFTTDGKSLAAGMDCAAINRWLRQRVAEVTTKANQAYEESKARGVPEEMLVKQFNFVLKRTSEDCISVVQVRDDQSENIIVDYQMPSIRKLIYG